MIDPIISVFTTVTNLHGFFRRTQENACTSLASGWWLWNFSNVLLRDKWVYHAGKLIENAGYCFHRAGVNNVCDPDKRKWLASSRKLKASLNSFLRVLVTSWSLQSCVDSHTIVLALCRRALLSSALGKKYWQPVMTPKSNPFKKRTSLWRKK